MDRINAMLFGNGDQARNIQISFDRQSTFAWPDKIRFIRLEAVQSKAIFIGVDRDCPQSQFRRCTEDANGNLASIRYQQFLHEVPLKKPGGIV